MKIVRTVADLGSGCISSIIYTPNIKTTLICPNIFNRTILTMAEKRKNSLKRELPKQKRIDSLRKQFASARMGKTERTNTFLNDPIAFHTQEANQEQEDSEMPDIEPWLEELESSETLKIQERKIRKEINYLLGMEAEEGGEQAMEAIRNKKVDNSFLAKKLKKYQPANSSFSLFYGEKKSIDKLKAEEQGDVQKSKEKYKLKLPSLPAKKTLSELKQLRNSKISRVSQSDRSLANSSPSKQYINAIGQIYKYGQILTTFSHQLINRIDRTSSMINKKYEYLNDVTDGMIEDVGKYQLEEEKNKSYRSIEYEVPVKYLKK